MCVSSVECFPSIRPGRHPQHCITQVWWEHLPSQLLGAEDERFVASLSYTERWSSLDCMEKTEKKEENISEKPYLLRNCPKPAAFLQLLRVALPPRTAIPHLAHTSTVHPFWEGCSVGISRRSPPAAAEAPASLSVESFQKLPLLMTLP